MLADLINQTQMLHKKAQQLTRMSMTISAPSSVT